MFEKKIEALIQKVLGQLIMCAGVAAVIGAFAWMAVKIWTSVIHMIF